MKDFLKRYASYLIVPAYMMIYMLSFNHLEATVTYGYHVIHCGLDSMIPFCEYFIVPYLLWFFYIGITVLWFMFKNNDKKEYYQLVLNLGIGMTLFLLISWLYPNGHNLRPEVFERSNIFVDMVQYLYRIDTPTNILPSIHVYNSVAAYMAIRQSKALSSRPLIQKGAFLLTCTIVMATMFLKQHTVIDVVSAIVLNLIAYLIIYRPVSERVTVRNRKIFRLR